MVLKDHTDCEKTAKNARQKTTRGGMITSPLEMARAEKTTKTGSCVAVREHGFS